MNCPLCSSLQLQAHWCADRYFRCETCKLIWLDERFRLAKEQEKKRYDTHQNQPTKEYLAYLSRVALPVVQGFSPGARGLDFGCGPTEGMKILLSPLQFRVESYDPFFFPQTELLNCRYDFVLCSEVAEHLFEPAKEFGQLAQLVREEGRLGISSALAPGTPAEFEAWWYHRDPTHVSFYGAETVAWICAKWGWQLEKLETPIWILRKKSGSQSIG